jgi:hypothetical protein
MIIFMGLYSKIIKSYHYTASELTLLDFCPMYGVHYMLLSTCVGSFACPGIDTRVQGTTVFSLCIHKFVCALVTLLDFCRRYGVHYRLLSTCVGSFACPGIHGTRHSGTRDHRFQSHPTDPLCIHKFVCALAGIKPVH